MQSRWNDAEAAALSGVDLLVYASRLVGAESSLVVWGGGNTSVKVIESDHRGREIPVLRVKGSGSDLKSIQRKDFPGVRMDDIRALLDRQEMGDEEMVAYLAHDYRRPGFKISRDVADSIAANPQARALVLSKHGTITWGATVREAYEATIELITRAEDAIAERKRGRPVFGGPRVPVLDAPARRASALDLLPRLRGGL